jgi:retrograde regulation protein 2
MASNAPDIITLDNLSQTLTPWNPQGESQLYAIVDMGRYTNLQTETKMLRLII